VVNLRWKNNIKICQQCEVNWLEMLQVGVGLGLSSWSDSASYS
jgi:hypothetical protein